MASSAAATEAQIKSEIERLTATINRHKAQASQGYQASWNGNGYKSSNQYYPPYQNGGRSNAYVNPAYKPSNKYIRPGLTTAGPSKPSPAAAARPSINTAPNAGTSTASPAPSSLNTPVEPGVTKEVVIGGVAFESSARSLVRKDLPKPANPTLVGKATTTPRIQQGHRFTRKPGHIPPTRGYKVKASRGRNMTLNNTRRPYSSTRKASNKRLGKYLDKPCPRFTTTGAQTTLLPKIPETCNSGMGHGELGACNRGLTCMYQHDPAKIAICWPFLQDNCPNTAETCNLSHDPTPERTPLCVHFLNKGRCTREKCLYPHVNVGKREGICRDFAVLGYCEKGLDCDRQHVRECPDFAEKGTCGTKGCKLPHVIRANRNRKAAAISVVGSDSTTTSNTPAVQSNVAMDTKSDTPDDTAMVTAEDAQLGDEYISLTFKESDSEDESDEEEEEEEDGDEGEEDGDSDSSMGDLEVNM